MRRSCGEGIARLKGGGDMDARGPFGENEAAVGKERRFMLLHTSGQGRGGSGDGGGERAFLGDGTLFCGGGLQGLAEIVEGVP